MSTRHKINMFLTVVHSLSLRPNKFKKWRVAALFVGTEGTHIYTRNDLHTKKHAEHQIIELLTTTAKYKELVGDIYVTLTPCYGRNTAISCSELLAQAPQIQKVYYLTKLDPNPRIKDEGVRVLGGKATYVNMQILEYFYYIANMDVLTRYAVNGLRNYITTKRRTT